MAECSKVVLAAGVFLAVAICSPLSRASSNRSQDSACSALQSADFSSLQDAPTQVMESTVVNASGEVPAHCHVQGYIAPQVGFELQLPMSTWNGKFIEIGCGGSCGTTRTAGRLFAGWCDEALRRNYACIVSNMGHASTIQGGGKNTGSDRLWAYNNLQAEFDFGVRAAHVAALAGKAITQHYYGSAPKRSYFMGCSQGGRQALVEAQRFPDDFDGIIAIDPAIPWCSNALTHHWNYRAAISADGKPLFSRATVELLHHAVVSKCDAMGDGVKDGVIGDPRTCAFDPAELACQQGQTAGCLTPAQVQAAKKIYSGPVTSKGEKIFRGGALPGSEYGGYAGFLAQGGVDKKADFLRYSLFMPDPGPKWSGRVDWDNDYKRMGMMEALYAAENPDLRQFKAAGGKLMIAQGWDDSGRAAALSVIDYYEMVERVMRGRSATQEFVRLFMMPGRAHCGGGPGANAIEFLSYLEEWVERGRAPDRMIGAHVMLDDAMKKSVEELDYGVYVRAPKEPTKVRFTRPIYPYPIQARYKGTGDPDDYRSFIPIGSSPVQ